MELEPVIGLEIHFQLKTKSKMFCRCKNIFGDVPPNSAICPICLGHPGTLPVPNKLAIEWTQRMGAALNCELATVSKFDRKHYFYPDLPKGYQISQFDQPLCGAGGLEITVAGQRTTVGITRLHLEEDAAKNTHPEGAKYSLIDFNRAGTPLMEIVTEPTLTSPLQAKIFLQEIQRIARTLMVSDADMEKGQMRCDANISLRPAGSTGLHPKTEIKNLNSFKFVAQALTYEIKRQTEAWKQGVAPETQSTRGFNSKEGVTTEQRSKEEAADYRYFPEPDIPPFEFTDQQLGTVRANLPELPLKKLTRFMREYDISEQGAAQLIANPGLASFFEATASELAQLDNEETELTTKEVAPLVKLSLNTILRQVSDLADYQKITPANFAELMVLVHQGRVNQGTIAHILQEMARTGGDPDHVINTLGAAQVSNEADLAEHIAAAITANPEVVDKIKAGKEAALQYLVGQVMARTKGKANPKIVATLLSKKIKP